MERANLYGDAEGEGTSGVNREAESTDAPVRAHCSVVLKRVECLRSGRSSPSAGVNRQREEPDDQWRAAALAR